MKLKDAFAILQDCSGILLPDEPDRPLVYPSLDINNDPENEFMYIGWGIEGERFERIFKEKNNQEIKVEGSILIFTDINDEEFAIIPLKPYLS